MRSIITLLLLMLSATTAAEWRIQSGPAQTLMIELYTSQGCNSCPPAEELVNRFTGNPRLWYDFIPLAFHVDYWDYLGWKDRYALPDNALRQRRYAQLGHVRGVYTPGFLVNGRGWRPGWFGKEPTGAAKREAGILQVSLADRQLAVRYQGQGAVSGQLELHLALLGMGLDTDIKAGENAGRHSQHEFVVLAHRRLAGGGPDWSVPMVEADSTAASRFALVAWISRPGDPTPLQAVGGYLPGKGGQQE